MALTMTGSAASRSASAKTICGALPPSSSVTGQWRFARLRRRPHAPVAGEPVNETCSMPAMRGERGARFAAEPVTMLSAPAGKPASAASSATRSSDRQASSAGLTTQALPAASAPPTRAAEDLHRVVPRNDVAGDAVRLAPGQHRVAGRVGNRLAVQLVAGAAVELEVARARRDVGARLLQRLAAVARLDQRELVGVIEDRARRAAQQPAALGRARACPRRRRARARAARTGGVDVGGVAARDGGERLAVGRVDHRQRRAGRRRRPSDCR